MLIRLFDPCETEPKSQRDTIEFNSNWTHKSWKIDVPSMTSENHYRTMTLHDGYVSCDCPAYINLTPTTMAQGIDDRVCKHIQSFNIAVGEAFLKVMRSMHFNVWQKNGMVMTQVLRKAYPKNTFIHSNEPERTKQTHDEGT